MEHIDSKAIEIFLKSSIDNDLVQKVVVRALQIIPCQAENPENKRLPSLLKFLNKLIHALNLNNGILMFTIIYLNRLKSKLPNNCKGLPSTRHRILLSCLILSIKFNNDFSLKNYDWFKLTNNLFNLKDINLMERQLLYLLNWNLFINEQEVFAHFGKFLNPIKDRLCDTYRMKKYLHVHTQKQRLSPVSSPCSFNDESPLTPVTPISPIAYGKNLAIPPPLDLPTSIDSYTRKTSTSSVSSLDSFADSQHGRSSSQSSIESLEITTKIHPQFELAALNERYELNKLLQSLKTTTI